MHRLFLPVLILLALLAGCAKQPQPESSTPAPTKPSAAPLAVHIVRTMVTGLDQYGDENIMVLNTADGPYVIGPDVSGPQLSEIHAHLTEAHDRVITIRYVDKPATATTVAHKRVCGLVIEERVYELNH